HPGKISDISVKRGRSRHACRDLGQFVLLRRHQMSKIAETPGRIGCVLRFHGDAELAPGLVDLAVNVRREAHPPWLAEPIRAALADLASYPDAGPARAAVAAPHGRPPGEVLLTAGAAQAFTLLAQA